MSVTMRIMQQFDPAHEREFMKLEKKFAQLEASRPDFPKGMRLKPISAEQPCNTLVWQCEFPDLNAAKAALSFFEGNSDHEALFVQQVPFFRQVKIEFYENLDF
jgi:hypothetical protein